MILSVADSAIAPVPTWLRGEWSRDWIQRGMVRSSTLDVHFLQTPTYFADVRIPKDRSQLSGAASFSDLTDQQLKLLATQNGFTGRTTVAGSVATWHHDLDYQPSNGTPDEGRLQRIPPDRMYEHGLDDSYVESWKSSGNGRRRFLVIRVERAGRLLRSLVVVGNQFIYVRNRAKDLPSAPSLAALIETTHATREQIAQYLDCEFSVGNVPTGTSLWEIEQSTLPWRVGHHLDFIEQVAAMHVLAGSAPLVGDEQWTVPVNTLSARAIKVLFGGRKSR